MPVAVLIADRGDARDAVGLYLAARGWTTVPLDPEPATVVATVARLAPGLVAIDYRGRSDDAGRCAAELAAAGVPVLLFNAPDDAPADGRGLRRASGADDVPDAPGKPAPPHAV
jgi:hypothetical protein